MMRRLWITTVSLLSLVAMTAVIDGCIDDGVGEVPSDLYVINHGGDAATPATATTTETTPASTSAPTGTDAGVPGVDANKPDANKPPPPPPPQDSGSDTGMPDTGSGMDSGGMMDATDDGG